MCSTRFPCCLLRQRRCKADRLKSSISRSVHSITLDAVQSELEGATKRHADATGPIKTKKNGKEFDDNILFLTMELQTLGVSSNIVGQVEMLCARHLAKRCALCSLHVCMHQ